MCSGRIDERFILKSFIAGADGILICGCKPGDCHYQQGNLNARRRLTGLSPFLDSVGVGKDRVRLEWVSAHETSKVADIIQSFTQELKQLGPSPFSRRHRQQCLSTT
jgi:F420-non-reducing hydrogenase iron-sulfur subunit